jgi:hypothetical protein
MGSVPAASTKTPYLMTSQASRGVMQADWASDLHLRRDRCYTTLWDTTSYRAAASRRRRHGHRPGG